MKYLELILTFFKIGAFTFGGGYAMLPLIQSEILSKNWLTNNELINFIAVSESTPGPFAVNIATYIGLTRNHLLGAACATFGLVLPSFIIILLVASFFEKFKESKIVKAVMSGLKPCVIGLILAAVATIGKSVLFPNGLETGTENIISAIIFLLCAVLAFSKKHPILIILLSALLGIISGFAFNLSL